jgi:hypothetical protein
MSVFSTTQCDLNVNCCATLSIRAALGPLPEQRTSPITTCARPTGWGCDVEAFTDSFVFEVR